MDKVQKHNSFNTFSRS